MRAGKTLRVEDELVFRELRLRLVRVEPNNPADPRDNSARFVARTPADSRELTIEEFRSDFIDDYEINVIEINPSSSRPGEGRVRIEVILRSR